MEYHRYNAKKCKKCGDKPISLLAKPTYERAEFHGWSRDVYLTDAGGKVSGYILGDPSMLLVDCRGCDKVRIARKVLGRVVNDIKCDGRCEAATGHVCDCQCGGKNHGIRHAA